MKRVMDPAIQRLIEFLDGSWVYKHTDPDPKLERTEIYRALMRSERLMRGKLIRDESYLLLIIALDFISVSQLIESSVMKYPNRMVFKTDIVELHRAMCKIILLLNTCIRGSKDPKDYLDLEMAYLELECLCFKLFTLKMDNASISYMSMVTCSSTTLHDDIQKIKDYLYFRET